VVRYGELSTSALGFVHYGVLSTSALGFVRYMET